MGNLAYDELETLFRKHKEGKTQFTRRMAIHMADMDGTTPKALVLRLERLGLLKRGSWDWFVRNGGITKEQIDQVRAEADIAKEG